MQERSYTAVWNVPHPPVTSSEGTWELLQSMLLVNWGWDLFIWDLPELLRLLTRTPPEFNYLFLTTFMKARAAYLAANGPFDCPQQTILVGLSTKRVQFASIYYRLLVPVLREFLSSERGAKLVGEGEARFFQLAIAEVERRYIEILEVIALVPEMDEVIHGQTIESWVTGTEIRNGQRVSALPAPVDVRVIAQRYGRHRLVRPSARDMVKKIKKREAFHTFLERMGAVNQTDIEFEKLSRYAKVGGFKAVKYGDLEVQYYLTLTNTEKNTLYVVCADRTMRIHQRNGALPGSRPKTIEVAETPKAGEELYLVTFDNGVAGIFAIDFRAHKENEHDHVPEEVLRMPMCTGIQDSEVRSPKSERGIGNEQAVGGEEVASGKRQERNPEATHYTPQFVDRTEGEPEYEERPQPEAEPGKLNAQGAPAKPAALGEHREVTFEKAPGPGQRLRVNVTVNAETVSDAGGGQAGIVELREHLDKKLDGVGQKMVDLTRENEALKGKLASLLTGIAQRVDPEFFHWIFVVLGAGSVNKAAGLLGIPNATLDVRLKQYTARGGIYRTLWGLVEARRKLGVKSIEHFNEMLAEHQPEDVRDESVVRDLLEGLEALNGENWEKVKKELIELIEATGL